ncbi:MAG: hypothetical protein JWO20_2602 [Candidatus Angelobacter sp.]|nr:hypothetical protein [Candidatus Angelobacter sp.]
MTKLKLNITMSPDGYVAGPNQNVEHPLGEADAGGAGVDRPVSGILGGESGSVRKIFGQTTNKGNQT